MLAFLIFIKMKTFNIDIQYKKIIADILTPISIYLRLRNKYANCILLESSDYHGEEHNYSYICFNAISGFSVEGNSFIKQFPQQDKEVTDLRTSNLEDEILRFISSFEIVSKPAVNCMYSGLFGYMTYDIVRYFEQIELRHFSTEIPVAQYHLYQFVVAYNHFNHEVILIKNEIADSNTAGTSLEEIETIIKYKPMLLNPFSAEQTKSSNFTDEDFLAIVEKGRQSCYRGDVFQLVLSRQFTKSYRGDDFNVYRALRSINPSPYCFYFDYGSFRLMGSSPEAQLIIQDKKVTIHPIAGTFKRSGDDLKDAALAQQLSNDPKENAEHIMLVDLARNDLSKCGEETRVEVYKEVQYYSHVIHLVSKVSAVLDTIPAKIKTIAATFPAGTLSGAPKYKAMQLIDEYENTPRGFYGGCIGHLDFNGDFNHAIMIRTIQSKSHTLTFQAGAGVVADSVAASELQEVENKLAAINKAIEMAVGL